MIGQDKPNTEHTGRTESAHPRTLRKPAYDFFNRNTQRLNSAATPSFSAPELISIATAAGIFRAALAPCHPPHNRQPDELKFAATHSKQKIAPHLNRQPDPMFPRCGGAPPIGTCPSVRRGLAFPGVTDHWSRVTDHRISNRRSAIRIRTKPFAMNRFEISNRLKAGGPAAQKRREIATADPCLPRGRPRPPATLGMLTARCEPLPSCGGHAEGQFKPETPASRPPLQGHCAKTANREIGVPRGSLLTDHQSLLTTHRLLLYSPVFWGRIEPWA